MLGVGLGVIAVAVIEQSAERQIKTLPDGISYQVTALARVTWSEQEIGSGERATDAAAACAAQLATYNHPGTSISMTISSFFEPEA